MAKKHDFQPDKLGAGFFSHLYLTKKQRRSLLKWSLYGAVLLALSLLQDVVLCRLRINGATTDLVPCAIFLITLVEGVESGCVFALVSSLCYYCSGSAPGIYAMVLITFLSVGFAIFRQSYLQKGFGAGLFCCTLALGIYELLVFFLGVFLGLTYFGRYIGFLTTWGITLPAIPLLYPIVLSIGTIGGETWRE